MKNEIFRFLTLRRYRITLVLIDICCIWLVVSTAAAITGTGKPSVLYYLVAIIVWLVVAIFFLLYSVWRYTLKKILCAVFTSWIFLNVLTFYFGKSLVKRELLLWMFPVFFMFMLIERILLKTLRFYRVKSKKEKEKKIVILGVGEEAEKIAQKVVNWKDLNYEIVGFVDLGQEEVEVERNKILGNINNLYKIVKQKGVSEVIIAPSLYTKAIDKKINKIIKDHSELHLSFKIASYLYDSLLGKLKIGLPSDFFLIDVGAESDKKIYFIYKRLLDFFGSFIILLLFSPILLLISFILKNYKGASVFYKQQRLGADGRQFTLYKFRSMVPDAENKTGPVWTKENDSRVTPFGRFLRKTSLDEFPQFWNVLKGDMSLVGPRPERPYFVKKYKELQGKRMNVKPGVTGLAQVNGRYDLNARHKAKYDYIYLKNCSFGLDLKILFETIWVVLTAKGVN
ncbi:MAG: sugar transferase [Candidatus Omnitrophica bacterium]|nr:sugar transferase [Candidatus Omnitrophota bacterium]